MVNSEYSQKHEMFDFFKNLNMYFRVSVVRNVVLIPGFSMYGLDRFPELFERTNLGQFSY